MTPDQVLDRLKDELEIPFLQVKVEDKEYSETEYQQLKKELTSYFDNYVRNVEN